MQKTLYIPIDTTLNYEFECPLLVKKYDTLKFKFAIFSLGILQDLNGQTVDIILHKKDGTTIQKTITDITLNIATIVLDKNASAYVGEVLGEIVITDTGGQATSNIFKFNVSNSLTEDINIKSSDAINTLQDMRALVEVYKEEIQAIGESVQATEALNNITKYIETNLNELTSKNSTATNNITNLKKENNRADINIPNLKTENDNADDKLEKFKLYDPTNLIQTVQDHGSQLNESAKYRNNTKYISKTIKKLRNGDATKIVCYGDSLTYGYISGSGTPDYNTNASQVPYPYPSVLKSYLDKVYPSNGQVSVINSGRCGWQSDEAISGLQQYVLDNNPDLAIIMFGTNDAQGSSFGGTNDIETYRLNMTMLIKSVIKSGVEVLLLGPPPTTIISNKILLAYSKVAKDIAISYNCGFVDMQEEILKLFLNKIESPQSLINQVDGVHFNSDKYKYIAQIVIGKALVYNNIGNLIYINNKTELPIVGVPYIDTDCNLVFNDTYSINEMFTNNYVLRVNGSTGTFLRFNFYCETNGLDLILKCMKSTNGGQVTITDNCTVLKIIDFKAQINNATYIEETLIQNLSIGFHSIEILTSNATDGQSSDITKSSLFFNSFLFKPTKTNNYTTFINSGYTHTPTLEIFNKVNDGIVRFTSNYAEKVGGMLLEKQLSLIINKKLIIEVEAIFADGVGFSWFGNKAGENISNQVNYSSGFVLYFTKASGTDTQLILYKSGDNNLITGTAGIKLATYSMAFATDLTISHKIRVEHNYNGEITIYIDDTQAITYTDTTVRSGYFGILGVAIGSIEIKRMEYCFV